MAIAAICVQCGKPKRAPLRQCKACGFRPESEYQIARALIFSSIGTLGGVPLGRDAKTLRALSEQIRKGRPYEFDPKEEQRAVEAYRRFREERDRRRAKIRRITWSVALAAIGIIGIGAWLYLRTR